VIEKWAVAAESSRLRIQGGSPENIVSNCPVANAGLGGTLIVPSIAFEVVSRAFRSVPGMVGFGDNGSWNVVMSMTVQVSIPDDLVLRLEQKARSVGLDREQYVRDLVSRDLAGPKTFDEILGGFREEVAASGMSDPELDQLFESARQDSLAERKNPRRK
jgi:hypothetical protein